MRVNMNKTKVMISGEWQKVTQKGVRWPCGVCGRRVGNNSILCRPTSCQKWARSHFHATYYFAQNCCTISLSLSKSLQNSVGTTASLC